MFFHKDGRNHPTIARCRHAKPSLFQVGSLSAQKNAQKHLIFLHVHNIVSCGNILLLQPDWTQEKKVEKKTSKQSFMQDQESSSCIFWHHWFGPSVAAAGSHVVRSSTYRTRWEVNITSFRFFLVSWGTQNRFRLWHFGTFSLPKEKSQRWKSSTLKVIRKMRWSMFFFFSWLSIKVSQLDITLAFVSFSNWFDLWTLSKTENATAMPI